MKRLSSKVLSVFMAAVILIGGFSFAAQAISLSSGTEALKAQLLDGVAPNGIDYVHFSPKKGEADTQKYPLMVWIHGFKSGDEPRAQIMWYEFCNWASDEYQSRFNNAGGCYLFAPRSENALLGWITPQTKTLKATIDYYISENSANIDMNRIYIGGYSTGGDMVWGMLSEYADFFAAGLPAAAIYQPAKIDLKSLGNMSVWMFNCDIDYYPGGKTSAAMETFNYLKEISSKPENVRMTNFSSAISPFYYNHHADSHDAEHYIWEAITYDMHMYDGAPYANTTTRDALGNEITFESFEENPNAAGVIDWLSNQTKADGPKSSPFGVFKKIIAFFIALFKFLRHFIVAL